VTAGVGEGSAATASMRADLVAASGGGALEISRGAAAGQLVLPACAACATSVGHRPLDPRAAPASATSWRSFAHLT
jgi:hypothetical protein